MRESLGLAMVLGMAAATACGQTIHGRGGITLPPPPDAQAAPVTDDYSGKKVTDDYRWLEDAKSEETHKFIDDENAYTGRYMKQAGSGRRRRMTLKRWLR